MKRLKDLIRKIKREKKEKLIPIPKEWVKHKNVNNVSENVELERDPTLAEPKKIHKSIKAKLLKPRKIRLRFLRSIKRVLAGILLIVHTAAIFLSFVSPIISLFFLVNAFLMLDYLWKTKIPTLEWGNKT